MGAIGTKKREILRTKLGKIFLGNKKIPSCAERRNLINLI